MTAKHLVAFAFLTIFWSASFFWIKIALEELTPLMVAGYRVLFGFLFSAIAMRLGGYAWPRTIAGWSPYIILGLTNLALPYLLLAVGEETVDSAIASMLNATTPLFALLIATLYLHDDKMTVRRLIGLLIGFAGVCLLLAKDIDAEAQNSVLGQLLILGSAFCYGASVVFMRRSTQDSNGYVSAAAPLLCASVFLWGSAWLTGSPLQLPSQPLTWVAILWLGPLGAGLSLIIYYYLVHEIGPTRASLVTFILPPGGVVLGVVFLNEPLSWQLAVSSLLILVSLLMVHKPSKLRSN